MGDTFGGRTWARPTNPTTGRSQGEIRQRAYNDQGSDKPDGCALFLFLPILLAAVAALLGMALT